MFQDVKRAIAEVEWPEFDDSIGWYEGLYNLLARSLNHPDWKVRACAVIMYAFEEEFTMGFDDEEENPF